MPFPLRSLLAEVQTPPDKYQGADKEEIRKKIKAEWAALYPKDEILAIRFHSDWVRDAKLVLNNDAKSLDRKDKSVLPVKVIVKTSDSIATCIFR